MLGDLLPALVKSQPGNTIHESDVVFVKNSCPLEGCSVYNLTGTTVTEFSIEWCVSTYLILDSSAMAVSCIHYCEGWILGWLFVRWFGFPGTGCWIRAGTGRHGGSKSSKSGGSYKVDESYKSDERVNYFSPNSSFRPVLVVSFYLNIYFFLSQLTAFVSI